MKTLLNRYRTAVILTLLTTLLTGLLAWKEQRRVRTETALIARAELLSDSLNHRAREAALSAARLDSLARVRADDARAHAVALARVRRGLSARTDTLVAQAPDTCAPLAAHARSLDSLAQAQEAVIAKQDTAIVVAQEASARWQGVARIQTTRADSLTRLLVGKNATSRTPRLVPGLFVGYGVNRSGDGQLRTGPVVGLGITVRLK